MYRELVWLHVLLHKHPMMLWHSAHCQCRKMESSVLAKGSCFCSGWSLSSVTETCDQSDNHPSHCRNFVTRGSSFKDPQWMRRKSTPRQHLQSSACIRPRLRKKLNWKTSDFLCCFQPLSFFFLHLSLLLFLWQTRCPFFNIVKGVICHGSHTDQHPLSLFPSSLSPLSCITSNQPTERQCPLSCNQENQTNLFLAVPMPTQMFLGKVGNKVVNNTVKEAVLGGSFPSSSMSIWSETTTPKQAKSVWLDFGLQLLTMKSQIDFTSNQGYKGLFAPAGQLS